MAQCKYIIKLPSGEQFELLAGFSTVEYTDTIEEEYTKYQESGSTDQLVEILKSLVPKQLSNANTLKAIIKKSDSTDNLLANLNERIEGLGDYSNIDDAIFKYVIKSENKGKELVKKLRKTVKASYFAKFGATGVIDMTSIAAEKKRVSIDNVTKAAYGFENILSSSLNTLMIALTRDAAETTAKKEVGSDMKLYGTNSPFIGKAWVSEDGVVVYEKGDDLSLFLGLFKREAMKLPAEKLLPLIEDLNKLVKYKKYGKIELPLDADGKIDVSQIDVNSFFNGVLKNDVIHESQFEKLLDLGEDTEISGAINNILKAVATNIDAKDKRLNAALKNLFWSLNPGNYGKNKLQAQLQAQQYMEGELDAETEFKLGQSPIISASMSPTARDQVYARSTDIEGEEDLFDNFTNQVTMYKDMVAFPISKDRTMYATPIEVKKQGKGVYIKGVRIGKTGDLQYVNYVFTDTITYRKMEEIIDPFVEGEPVEAVGIDESTLLVSDDFIPQEVIKRFVRRGDLVSGKLVVGVYPGYIRLLNTNNTYTDSKFQAIKSFVSRSLKEDIEVQEPASKKSLVSIQNSADISEGDFVEITTKNDKIMFKRVILADKDNVWYTIPNPKHADTYMVKSVPKKGLKGVKDVFGTITIAEIQKVMRSKSMSSFTNPNKTREGDLVKMELEGNYVYGKVLNDNKVYITGVENKNSRQVVDISTLEGAEFFTDRDISEEYSLYSIRVNSNKVSVGEDADESNPLKERMFFAVPKGTDPESIRNISENTFNIGSFKNAVDGNTEEDFTETALELMSQPKDSKIYAEFESSNSKRYVKTLPNMTEIKYFNNLTEAQKNELDVLQKGTYFSVFSGKFIEFDIYRITDVDGDEITARIYKLRDGKVVTTERIFDRKTLLANELTDGSNPTGKIAKLYMINGNRKMGAIMGAVNKFSNKSDLKGAQAIATRLQSSIKGLPIEIEFVESDGVFEHNQKARIVSDDQGMVKLQVNKDIGKKEDVVHEFLHMFLTPLRYKSPEIYDALIKTIVQEELDVTAAEEAFVEVVSKRLVRNADIDGVFNANTLQGFVDGLKAVLTDFQQAYDILEEDNPITLLNTPLSEIFDVAEANLSPAYNKSMLSTEPMMRE